MLKRALSQTTSKFSDGNSSNSAVDTRSIDFLQNELTKNPQTEYDEESAILPKQLFKRQAVLLNSGARTKRKKGNLYSCLTEEERDDHNEFDEFEYIPKESYRVARNLRGSKKIKGDGETWVERTVIMRDGSTQTYFIAINSRKAFWDEPPTGASRIILIGDDDYPDHIEAVHLKGHCGIQ